jgi:hypothetical protein
VQDYSPDPIYAEVVFEATLPAAIPENTILQLEILDEVSCLNFNPIRYEMSLKGETTYYVRLPLPIDSVVKYRFILTTSPVMIERNSQGVDVRYAWLSSMNPESSEILLSHGMAIRKIDHLDNFPGTLWMHSQ